MATRKTRKVARSAKSGKFVSKSYAKSHKATTEVERVRIVNKRVKRASAKEFVGGSPHGSGDKP